MKSRAYMGIALVIGFAASLSVAGCSRSGHAPDSAASLRNSNESPSIASSRGSAAVSGPTAGAPAPASPAAADEMARSESEERPGLGTSWGEAVSSHVSSTTFYRHSDSSPDGVASLFYNHEASVGAMSH